MSLLQTFLDNEASLKRLISRIVGQGGAVPDIAQETYLRAAAAERKTKVVDPRAFLFEIARNLSYNERKRMVRRKTASLGDFDDPDVIGCVDEPSPEDRLDSGRKLALIAQAVERMPEKRRRAFVLRKIEGLSQEEIAAVMGISVKTVENHITAALNACVEHLAANGYEAGGTRRRGSSDHKAAADPLAKKDRGDGA